ncbi:tyrosine-type recombinase/integrase [Micromonospora sp. NPDC092111]|uniref:tyrosine-type recombinase/integrase n=1 Tax=Micromonospora sp. NPDC092111 TaxID=3364289 RepID=UPI0037F396F7
MAPPNHQRPLRLPHHQVRATPVRLHDLRHCAASYLRHGGADMKEVQETLGHSTIGLTSDTYTSVILDLERGSADAAADLIARDAASRRRGRSR